MTDSVSVATFPGKKKSDVLRSPAVRSTRKNNNLQITAYHHGHDAEMEEIFNRCSLGGFFFHRARDVFSPINPDPAAVGSHRSDGRLEAETADGVETDTGGFKDT
ncbi:hypothetical protein EYF80_043025 [Liparis tanakae]|uniref:Uncharacterized protein n=1 Tax=Liparis tanakae TaxID=230148 RepID=A0A4Z2G1I5_9TELE|nr:hypothetical protein EYF80_043025 [Liparis tanakae]